MKCYSIQYEGKGYYIAAHSLVNSLQCFCDYIGRGFMSLPSYGVAVARISRNQAKAITIYESTSDSSGESLSQIVSNRKDPGVVATYKPVYLDETNVGHN